MRHHVDEFTNPDDNTQTLAANGSLEFPHAHRFTDKTVHVIFSGVVNMTIKLEGTIDGTNWAELAIIPANSITYVQESVAQLRVSVTNWVSGSISAVFGGFDPRVGY
jgi:hypothetical protein